ncbi:MAG: hypothetical protein RI897_3474 [Verrucomicrobiota bacterium]|jgi:chemotaxis protein MotB
MKNPFHSAGKAASSESTRGGGAAGVRLRGFLLGCALLAGLAFVVLELREWRNTADWQERALRQEHARATRLLQEAAAVREARDGALERLEQSLEERARLGSQLKELEQEREKATEQQTKLEAEMRAALESKDVTISELAGKLTVNILDRVLFASGEASIKEEGQAVLSEVAGFLAAMPERQIQVIGHTDNVPIATARFPSNWELSAARALAAVRFLSEEAGVDPKRLGALAQGEFHPIADNSTPEGRAKNRRIAIVVLPEILSKAAQEPADEVASAAPEPVEAQSLNGNEDNPEGSDQGFQQPEAVWP